MKRENDIPYFNVKLQNGFTRNFVYNTGVNTLQKIETGSSALIQNFTYDNCGNLITETSSRHFEWDFGNRLRSFYVQSGTSEPTQYAQYLYDAGGTRIKKIVRSQGGSYTSTVYINDLFEYKTDGTNEQNLLHVMDDSNRIAMVRLGYNFGDTTPAIKYNLVDHLGNSTLLLETNGSLVNKEEYYPFGETSFGSYGKKRYKFSGKECDEESGMYYFKYRYSSPWTCRFISVDPLSADYPYNSSYSFAENRVINGVELEGLEYVNSNAIINNETGETFGETFGDLYSESPDRIIEHEGDIYYKVSLDIYRNESPSGGEGSLGFRSGDEKTRITEWIYPDINLAKESDYVKYSRNCFSAASKEASNLGTDVSSKGAYYTTIQMSNSGNGPRKATEESIRYGLNMINQSLDMGVPIVVGIDYGPGDGGGNYDGTTDHFVVITGKGADDDGDYFLYHDNAQGSSGFYKLYVDGNGNIISNDPNSFIGEGATVSNVVMNNQLLEKYNNIHLTK